MPLPNYNTRSDSFGNYYFGGFQVDSQVEVGYGAGTSIAATQTEWETFLTTALGASNWTKTGTGSSTDYYFRFANAWEPLTNAISTTANYRFSWMGSTLNADVRLNTATTGTPVNISRNGTSLGNMFGNTGYVSFAVANQYGMWIAALRKGTTPGTLGTTAEVCSYFGWVKDPVFPTNTNDRIRNCIIGGSPATNSSFICSRANATTTTGTVSVNNVITCQTSTPGANVTDLCFIDTNSSNLNIGSAYNALIYPGSLTIGQIYRIPPASDPDGNTEQNIWLCTSSTHLAFNGATSANANCSRLIRVWSNNIS